LRNSQAGVSIIELLISIAILGVFMLIFVGFQTETMKRFSNVTTDTGENAIMRLIQEEVLKDERYIVPQSSLGALEAATLSDAALASSFASASTEVRCYSKNGVRVIAVTAENPCSYRVTYYRVAVKDRRYPAGSIYAKVPISRMNFKIEFVKEKKNEVVYISKLLTNVLPY